MAKENITRNFMLDPNQEARRAELAAFIGPNAAKFMRVYDGWQAITAGTTGQAKPRLIRGFVPAAFFLGPTWFFYRKMWIWAVVVTVLEFGVGLIPHASRLGAIFSITFALLGMTAYIDYAIKRITILRGAAPIADLALLQREGGVSKPAGWISGGIVVLIMILAMISIIYLASQNGGHPPTDL